MQVAITGASGLIGTALRRSLEAAGHTPIPLTRRPDGSGIGWDPAAGEIDAAALEGIDAVVHLAGEPIAGLRWTDAKKKAIRDSRIDGTTLLASTLAGLKRPPSVLLSGSAIGYYGDRGDEILTEDSTPGDDFLASVCRQWEAATAPAHDAGITVATLRTGLVLSPDGGLLGRLLPLFKWGLGGRLGRGRQYMSWISIDDHVAAMSALLADPVSGPVNLTAPAPVTNREFTRVLASALNRPAVFTVPSFAPRLALGAELADSLLFSSARVEPVRLVDLGFAFSHDTLDEALAHLVG